MTSWKYSKHKTRKCHHTSFYSLTLTSELISTPSFDHQIQHFITALIPFVMDISIFTILSFFLLLQAITLSSYHLHWTWMKFYLYVCVSLFLFITNFIVNAFISHQYMNIATWRNLGHRGCGENNVKDCDAFLNSISTLHTHTYTQRAFDLEPYEVQLESLYF